ncbi:DJ-1/PfpI family protein [Maricurvus nonylphenolicus]|uniref:GlxA family transcriptional regulator n=1 Tax=Maricurvus nonylphenolicus TaxID=1008307 RepID=UPI0036F29532
MTSTTTSTRTLCFVAYNGFMTLDYSGPASVFSSANAIAEAPLYKIKLLSVEGDLIASESGIEMMTQSLKSHRFKATDTVFVPGANLPFLQDACDNQVLIQWLKKAKTKVGQMASVCTGAFIFAEAGILEKAKATTHWAACNQFQQLHPDIELDQEALYLQNDNVWTSAGVTTGIDMALAMLEQDHGSDLMGQVAKALVIYAHRPGNQSQFSSLLDQQLNAGDQFGALINWLEANLDKPIKVEQMADQAGMSERNFYRRFTETMGVSPAKYLEIQRLERARQLLVDGNTIKRTCHLVGFKSEAAFRTAFKNRFGLSPSLMREMHSHKA